ncbi:hypothetical protein BCV69DRAFT_297649 [Microstroma glucosiphilum]|uniref:BHLH domain-containing protein n=1 Tax=Pseudomicrostroma glucosiphilum TaxID=1684307 RepID=A0A316UAW4_9BASI|nr:hypothetical protein BCV69DRAFT_297649 [Pseudomicrostroma glucosiphilum]PWN22357.1 hypothetical protein BCV69DRAFT_297649 [Pseudomicrostroma glucosiphilum]
MVAPSQKQIIDSPVVSASSSSSSTSLSPPPAPTPTPAAAPAQRKSRVLSRKTHHSVIERRRREKINERLIRLQCLIPACREEALDLLSTKPPKAARGKGVSPETKAKEIERSLSGEMVLEKLCIISHSVDYILELQTQVAAYRKLCMCDPPVGDEMQPRDHQLHVEYAHEGILHRANKEEDGGVGSERDGSPSVGGTGRNSDTLISPATKVGAGSFKRKRHWGSNRIPKPTATAPSSVKRTRVDSRQSTSRPTASSVSPTHETVESLCNTDVESHDNDDDDDDDDESEEESHEAVTEPEVDDEGYLAFSTDSNSSIDTKVPSPDPSTPGSLTTSRRPSLLSPSTYQLPPIQQQQQQQQQYPASFPSLQSAPTHRARLRLQRVPGILSLGLGLTPDDRLGHRMYSRYPATGQPLPQVHTEGEDAEAGSSASASARVVQERGKRCWE